MKYSELLSSAIKQSGLTYNQLITKLQQQGVTVSKSYISKLCNGASVATDTVNGALASVLETKSDLNFEELRLAAYKAKFPSVVQALESEQQGERTHGT